MVRPIDVRWPRTQAFGSNPQWAHQLGIGHTGEDIGAPEGTDVVAVNSGRVMFANWGQYLTRAQANLYLFVYKATGSGIQVIIDHEDGVYTSYSHLSRTDMPGRGERVLTGQKIGEVGNTGFSFGAHLHGEATRFQDMGNGRYGRFDPATYYNRFPRIVAATDTITPVRKYTEDEQFFVDLGIPLP